MRQETELWLQHRALWDWKSALGLAEKRDSGDRGRKYKVSPYSEGFCWNPGKLVSEATCHLPAKSAHSIKPGLDNTLCLSLTRKGSDPLKVRGYCLFRKSSSLGDRSEIFLQGPKPSLKSMHSSRHCITQYLLLTARFILGCHGCKIYKTQFPLRGSGSLGGEDRKV